MASVVGYGVSVCSRVGVGSGAASGVGSGVGVGSRMVCVGGEEGGSGGVLRGGVCILLLGAVLWLFSWALNSAASLAGHLYEGAECPVALQTAHFLDGGAPAFIRSMCVEVKCGDAPTPQAGRAVVHVPCRCPYI